MSGAALFWSAESFIATENLGSVLDGCIIALSLLTWVMTLWFKKFMSRTLIQWESLMWVRYLICARYRVAWKSLQPWAARWSSAKQFHGSKSLLHTRSQYLFPLFRNRWIFSTCMRSFVDRALKDPESPCDFILVKSMLTGQAHDVCRNQKWLYSLLVFTDWIWSRLRNIVLPIASIVSRNGE